MSVKIGKIQKIRYSIAKEIKQQVSLNFLSFFSYHSRNPVPARSGFYVFKNNQRLHNLLWPNTGHFNGVLIRNVYRKKQGIRGWQESGIQKRQLQANH